MGSGSHTQALLEALPQGGDCRTLDVLSGLTGLSHRQVSDACAILIRHGLVTRVSRGCFGLSKAGAEARAAGKKITSGPNGQMGKRRSGRRKTARQKLWTYLRACRSKKQKVTAPEIATMTDISAASIQAYLAALRNAGYVAWIGKPHPGTAPTSNGFRKYFLVRDTGALAPAWNNVSGEMFDPNLGEVTWRREGTS
ncbi:MAG: hypothetical protein ACPGO3_00245 [Magnetospiraceae bacterium]